MAWVCVGCAAFAFIAGFFCGKKYFHYWWTEDATDIITRYNDDKDKTLRAVTVYYDKSLFLEDRDKLGWSMETKKRVSRLRSGDYAVHGKKRLHSKPF